jgi:DNA repair protein
MSSLRNTSSFESESVLGKRGNPSDSSETLHQLSRNLSELHCNHKKLDGNLCLNKYIDGECFSQFGEMVCKSCKFESDDFQLITRTEALTKYLIPDSTLKTIKHQPKINLQHPTWAPMQLFLRKQIKEAAIARFGSIESINEEVSNRGEKKFQRELVKMANTLSDNAADLKAGLTKEEFSINKSESSVTSSRKTKARNEGVKGNLTGGKKRSTSLLDMVKCIRG